jgi:hypothetical protein
LAQATAPNKFSLGNFLDRQPSFEVERLATTQRVRKAQLEAFAISASTKIPTPTTFATALAHTEAVRTERAELHSYLSHSK